MEKLNQIKSTKSLSRPMHIECDRHKAMNKEEKKTIFKFRMSMFCGDDRQRNKIQWQLLFVISFKIDEAKTIL